MPSSSVGTTDASLGQNVVTEIQIVTTPAMSNIVVSFYCEIVCYIKQHTFKGRGGNGRRGELTAGRKEGEYGKTDEGSVYKWRRELSSSNERNEQFLDRFIGSSSVSKRYVQ